MRQSGWYSLSEKNNCIVFSYKKANRIKAGVSFLLILIIYIYYLIMNNSFGNNSSNLMANIIVIGLLILVLTVTLIIDSYSFCKDDDFVLRRYGVYPFVVKKKIVFDKIEGMEIVKTEKKTFREYLSKRSPTKYYIVSISHKNGNIDHLGIYKEEHLPLLNLIKSMLTEK